MKYQIQQSRLDKVVMTYLDSIFSGVEEHTENIGDIIYRWWGKDDKEMMDISTSLINEEYIVLGIYETIYDGLKSMFNLNKAEADGYFLWWFEKNIGISANEVDTFR